MHAARSGLGVALANTTIAHDDLRRRAARTSGPSLHGDGGRLLAADPQRG